MKIRSHKTLNEKVFAGACLIIGSVYVLHFALFATGNGLCMAGGTGRIAGNQAAGAGALPRLSAGGYSPVLSLDMTRPLSSNFVFISDIICIFALILGLIFLISGFGNSGQLRKSISLCGLTAAIILICVLENFFSCEMNLIHKNIQNIFISRPKSVDFVVLPTRNVVVPQLIELHGHQGEATCRAFVASAQGPGLVDNQEKWSSYDRLLHSDDAELRAIALEIGQNYSNKNDIDLYINFKKFERETEGAHAVKNDKYSVVGCLVWPHPWIDRLP